ncbi:SH3 domain-containing protein, partial [Romboutsia sp.]|uniref:SH3 domain-containing protein n=1 Tax=Romboutsia sp. TaxID=1965302 RepID=UPI002C341627
MKKKIALATLAMIPMTVNNVHASAQIGIVTTSSLNVRSGPGTNYTVLFTVKKNDKVDINETSNGWYKIKTSSGKEGWASSTYISKSNSNDNSNESNILGEKKRVTVNRLNMRSGAGTSYRVIITLNKGDVLDVVSENNGWTKVKYNGRLGYISSEYLEDIKSESSQEINKEVNTDSLNVRSGPNTSYSIVGSLKKGEKVNVISERNGWSKIDYKGETAYTSSRYLKNISGILNPPTEPSNPDEKPESVKEIKVVNTSSLNVRSGPGINYSKVGNLRKDEKIGIISESNGWSKIEYKGKVAYTSSQYLTKQGDTTPNPPTEPSNPDEKPEGVKEIKVVNTSSLNVRSGPGISYSKVGNLRKDEKVGIISESNGWSKIEYKGKVAYTSSQYLSKQGDITPNPPTEPPNQGGDTSENINGATVNYKTLSYTLDDHVRVQQERASIGGNVIDSSKPRSSEVMTTVKMKESRGFVLADKSDLEYFLNPSNFTNSSKGMMQFLRIDSYKGGISASELNLYLNSLSPAASGTNVFYNQGQTFINAAQKYNIDLVYLVSHAMWETGYGKSTLAQGQTITSFKGQPLNTPVTVYN